jgi:hypothetical protein
MRSRALPALIGVTALTIATALTGTASASSGPVASTSGAATASRSIQGASCPGAENLNTANGDGITAQDFEASFDIYDAMGAAKFKTSGKCKVKALYIEGLTGLPTGFNWAIYTSKAGAIKTPDKQVKKCAGKVNLDGSASSFKFKVKKGCKLKANTEYFLTGQAQLEFGTGGQWFWGTTDTQKQQRQDLWQNPGGGFGVGCATYDTIGTCLGFSTYNYIFAVQKN